MVILIIHENDIGAFKHESHSPIAIDRDRVLPCESAAQRVQPPSRHIHIVGGLGKIQPYQLSLQSGRMVRLYARLAAGLEKKTEVLYVGMI